MPEANTPDHYFSAQPASAWERRDIRVRLAGADRVVETARGVFSPEHLDTGTRVLLDAVPSPPAHGNLFDVGCGWGPIALSLAIASPEATVWAIDVNERALDLVRRNAQRLGVSNIRAVRPDEVPEDLQCDAIWSNPPIRIGKTELHALLDHWLARLGDNAEAWLVVQKNLGADSLHAWLRERFPHLRTERVTSEKGFRIFRVTNAKEPV